MLFDEVEASVTAVTGCELVGAGVVVSGCAGCVAAAVAGSCSFGRHSTLRFIWLPLHNGSIFKFVPKLSLKSK